MFKKITIIAFIAFLASASLFVHNVYANGFKEVKKLRAGDANYMNYFGNSVSISGDYAIVGAIGKEAGDIYPGAAYIFYKDQGGTDNWGEVIKLTASGAEDMDFFGNSVSISGDYAIVGAYGKDTDGLDAGAAYIFYKDQDGLGNWGEAAKLMAGDAQSGDAFGYSVSISGDYVVVGTWGDVSDSLNGRAAYIFYKDQGGPNNWGQVAKLMANDTQVDNLFGGSVSISGDYAIVGAYGEDTGGIYTGAAYVFYKDQDGADNWGQVTKLMASDAQAGDYFGGKVSISGDYAIVGASGEDAAGSERGAAYIFNKDQGGTDNWGQVTKLTASDAKDKNYFGFSLSISDDFAVVGVATEAAYMFNKDQGGTDNWGQVEKLTASDAVIGNSFSSSVSISGDYVIVGADRDGVGGYFAGAAYMYKLITTGVEETPEISDVVIYPEIADDIITIEYTIENSGISENRQAAIYSIDGRKLIEQPLDGEQTIINIANLTPGTYFIEVGTAGVPVVRKFIKR